MKKYVLLLPSVIYTCMLGLFMLIALLPEKSDENGMFYSIAGIILFAAFISGIVCNIITATRAVKNKWDIKELLKVNLILKYLQLPINICSVLGGVGMIMMLYRFRETDSSYSADFIRAFMLIGTCALVVELLGVLIHSGSIAVAGVIRAKSMGMISKKTAVRYGFASFIVFADIVVAHLLYKGARNEEISQMSD